MTDTIPDESRKLLELIAAQTFEVPDGYECQQQLTGCVRNDQLTEEQRLDLIPLLDRKLVARSTRTCEGPTYIGGTVFAAGIPHTPRLEIKVIEITDRGELEMKSHPMQSGGEPAAGKSAEQTMAQLMQAVGDDNAGEIYNIAQRKDITADEKMRLIAAIDVRFRGKKSPEWGILLDVDSGAIRQTQAWKDFAPDRGKIG